MKISWLKKAASNCCKIKKKTPSKANIARSSAESQPLPAAPSMAEHQAKFSQINVGINQSLSINIQYNMFVLH
jgi:hypothetical protein